MDRSFCLLLFWQLLANGIAIINTIPTKIACNFFIGWQVLSFCEGRWDSEMRDSLKESFIILNHNNINSSKNLIFSCFIQASFQS